MLKNYIKIGLKVLRRRPFYTFISLFGISITLMVMMLVYTLYQNYAGNTDVMRNFANVSIVNRAKLVNDKTNWNTESWVGYRIYKHCALKMKSAEMVAIASNGASEVFYYGNKRFSSDIIYCDAAFWKVLSFHFLKGRNFNQPEVDKSEKVAILSETACRDHFGNTNVIGKTLKICDYDYKVIGIVKNVSSLRLHGYAHIYLPVTCSKEAQSDKDLLGDYCLYFKRSNHTDFKTLNREWQHLIKSQDVKSLYPDFERIECEQKDGWNKLEYIFGFSLFKGMTLIWIVTIMALLFMLLPALNQVSINVTRILERSSEIGIRKSFGASKKVLVYQFLVENFMLTAIGGTIGFVLTLICMYLINNGLMVSDANLQTDYSIFLFALFITFLFNLFSGTYPAIRMSKLNIINALKEENI